MNAIEYLYFYVTDKITRTFAESTTEMAEHIVGYLMLVGVCLIAFCIILFFSTM